MTTLYGGEGWFDFSLDVPEGRKHSEGGYVLHADYAALEARVAELERDAAKYRKRRNIKPYAIYFDEATLDSSIDDPEDAEND